MSTSPSKSWAPAQRPTFLRKTLDLLFPVRRAHRNLRDKSARLEAFLQTTPLEYYGWDMEGTQALSQGFLDLLGIESVSMGEIQAALSPADGAALAGLYARLVKTGEAFEIGVRTASAHRTLKLYGRRGVAEGEHDYFFVLWALDVTDFAEAAMRSVESRRRAEKKEDDFRTALNALPFPVWTRDEDLHLSWCNKMYARLMEETAATVVAEQRELLLKTGPAKIENAPRALAQRALTRLSPQSMRGHVIQDGQRRLMEATEIPLPSDRRSFGFALDVTREEELEADYLRLGKNQRDVLEHLRTAIAMFDRDARLDFYNTAYEQLTGMSGAWLDTRPRLVDVIDKMRELRRLPEQADYKQYKQAWLGYFNSLLDPHEEMLYLPDGTVIRMIVLPRPMGGIMVTLEDVTSRVKLETSYNTLMAVQQETFDNLSEGVAVFGEDGRLRLSNEAYIRLWNVPRDEIKVTDGGKGPHISRLIEYARPLFLPGVWDAARQELLANALERAPRKGRVYRAGSVVLEYSVVPLPDGNILNAWFDITDSVKVEQALIEKNAAFEEAEHLKTQFLANVSYQLRTPLNAIIGFAEMLSQQYFGSLNERQLEYIGSVIQAGERLVSLINDILDLSSVEAGYLKLNPEPVQIADLITQVVQLTAEWVKKQGIGVIVEDPPQDFTIQADGRRLKQVLLNLVSNAINYSPHGGTLTLAARQDGTWAVLTIKDTGIGIAPAELSRVFTPFERIRHGKVQRRSGAGLGLALVKSIIELHGGTVHIDSTEGVGTTVTVRLPVGVAESNAA